MPLTVILALLAGYSNPTEDAFACGTRSANVAPTGDIAMSFMDGYPAILTAEVGTGLADGTDLSLSANFGILDEVMAGVRLRLRRELWRGTDARRVERVLTLRLEGGPSWFHPALRDRWDRRAAIGQRDWNASAGVLASHHAARSILRPYAGIGASYGVDLGRRVALEPLGSERSRHTIPGGWVLGGIDFRMQEDAHFISPSVELVVTVAVGERGVYVHLAPFIGMAVQL